MRDRKFIAGVAISAVWIAAAAWIVATQEHPTKLNEWGDFIAGFSAPLAFLWLVLGYMQQGEELRHSTQALKLQAEELKNSVEQQSQLVAVSREQVRVDLEVIAEERERRRIMALPKFVAERLGSVESSGIKRHNLKFTNVGQTATEVEFKIYR
ncbi:hypothetical protein AB4142_18720 [Variovorax sp. 2RAF20]|jgi:hypothetical protein